MHRFTVAHGALAALCASILVGAGCGGDDGNGGGPGAGQDGGVNEGGPGGGGPLPNGMAPWPVFDGTVPDVPPSANGKTYYCDPVKGDDTLDGASFTASGGHGPKKTINAALPQLKPGDTLLLGGGVYRENLFIQGQAGSAGAPITIGSYGHGTGAPILDGGLKPAAWTKYTAQGQTTVWQMSAASIAPLSKYPVLGIYVNSGKAEFALREVAHGQLNPNPLPVEDQTKITDNSSKWYWDSASKTLYADFGGVLGSGDPNAAEVSILYNTHKSSSSDGLLLVLPKGSDYWSFIGLTFRASSWDGAYVTSSNNTFDHCDFKFNGGGGVIFDTENDDPSITGNTVKYSRIWMNVLDNWPRFNNANVGGGWPAAMSWYAQSNATSLGNVVYGNGGEGTIFWGTTQSGGTEHVSTGNSVKNCVLFDNFSVNLYFDNTQNVKAEQNFVFQHPRDAAQTFDGLLQASTDYNEGFGRALTPLTVSLADEPGSAYDGKSHLQGITLINNLIGGGKRGMFDYPDGDSAAPTHGLRNCTIANNTWVLASDTYPGGQDQYVWDHGSIHPDPSTNSIVANNIFVTGTADDFFVRLDTPGAIPQITTDFNLYSGPGKFTGGDFNAWKSAMAPWDAHSVAADAQLADIAEFSQKSSQKLIYDWQKAIPKPGSPAIGKGTPVPGIDVDFTGQKRPAGSLDLGALSHR